MTDNNDAIARALERIRAMALFNANSPRINDVLTDLAAELQEQWNNQCHMIDKEKFELWQLRDRLAAVVERAEFGIKTGSDMHRVICEKFLALACSEGGEQAADATGKGVQQSHTRPEPAAPDTIDRALERLRTSWEKRGMFFRSEVSAILTDLAAEIKGTDAQQSTATLNGTLWKRMSDAEARLDAVVDGAEYLLRFPPRDIREEGEQKAARKFLAIARGEGGERASQQADTAGALPDGEPRQPAAPDAIRATGPVADKIWAGVARAAEGCPEWVKSHTTPDAVQYFNWQCSHCGAVLTSKDEYCPCSQYGDGYGGD